MNRNTMFNPKINHSHKRRTFSMEKKTHRMINKIIYKITFRKHLKSNIFNIKLYKEHPKIIQMFIVTCLWNLVIMLNPRYSIMKINKILILNKEKLSIIISKWITYFWVNNLQFSKVSSNHKHSLSKWSLAFWNILLIIQR